MQLQTKINIRFLLLSLIVFIVGGIFFYVGLNEMIRHEIKDKLKNQQKKVLQYINSHPLTDSITYSPDHFTQIKLTNHKPVHKRLIDTLLYDTLEKEPLSCRQLIFSTIVQDKVYEVRITQSLLESDEMAELIVYFLVILFVALIGLLFFVNRWVSASIWKSFYISLDKLNAFEIGKSESLRFDKTNISEFDRLNKELEMMTKKIQVDFINLKEFTENASHEIQTPLAIIKSKLELVLQDKSLSNEQHRQLHAAYESAGRLSKLNEALLLLSKIENNQFAEKKEIDFIELVKLKLEYLEELIDMKQIEVETDIDGPIIVSINPLLADILINNLLSNALKHNTEHGKIKVVTRHEEIVISNTGEPLSIEPSKLFQRFTKHKSSFESTGLGLAIANEICKNFNLTLQYEYTDGQHKFILRF